MHYTGLKAIGALAAITLLYIKGDDVASTISQAYESTTPPAHHLIIDSTRADTLSGIQDGLYERDPPNKRIVDSILNAERCAHLKSMERIRKKQELEDSVSRALKEFGYSEN